MWIHNSAKKQLVIELKRNGSTVREIQYITKCSYTTIRRWTEGVATEGVATEGVAEPQTPEKIQLAKCRKCKDWIEGDVNLSTNKTFHKCLWYDNTEILIVDTDCKNYDPVDNF